MQRCKHCDVQDSRHCEQDNLRVNGYPGFHENGLKQSHRSRNQHKNYKCLIFLQFVSRCIDWALLVSLWFLRRNSVQIVVRNKQQAKRNNALIRLEPPRRRRRQLKHLGSAARVFGLALRAADRGSRTHTAQRPPGVQQGASGAGSAVNA